MGLVWLVDGWKMEGEGLRGGEAALWMGLVWLLEGWKIRGEGLRGGEACWCVGGEWTEVAGARGVCLCVPWAGGSRCSLGEGSGNLKQIGFYPAGGVISRLTVFFFLNNHTHALGIGFEASGPLAAARVLGACHGPPAAAACLLSARSSSSACSAVPVPPY